jgi:hypothetical protein
MQNTIWVAEYNDGSLLREWDDDGNVHLFKDIIKEKLSRFHLVSVDADYVFDCKTGIFSIDSREFVFPLAGMSLNFAEGLIQYKEASTEFIPVYAKNSDYDGFEIQSYNFGWKVTHENLKVQAVFSLPEKVFTIEMTILDIQKTLIWKVKV